MTDDELVTSFESGREPAGGFHHEQHVRVAWIYLGQAPLIPALTRFVTALKRFAAAQEKPDLYHETITVAFFLLIEDHLARHGRGSRWQEFAALHPDLFTRHPSLLARYYSSERLLSPLARARFVWPDLKEPTP